MTSFDPCTVYLLIQNNDPYNTANNDPYNTAN
jgi:hypothetical protein